MLLWILTSTFIGHLLCAWQWALSQLYLDSLLHSSLELLSCSDREGN